MSLDRTVLTVDRDAGEVAHMLVGPGELVEQRRLAAVLVAGERERDRRAVGQRRLGRLVMEACAALAQAGVAERRRRAARLALLAGVAHVGHLDPGGVVQAQRQLVAMYAHFDRIAHRGVLDHGHVRLGDQAHIQKMLAQRSVAADALDRGGLADGQLFQCRQSSVSSQGWRSGGRSASSEVFRLPPPFRFSSSVTAHYKGFGETAQQARSARNQSGMEIEQRRWSGDENQPPWHRFYPIERRNPLLAEVFIPNGFRWMIIASRRQGTNGRRRPSPTSFPDEAIRRCLM